MSNVISKPDLLVIVVLGGPKPPSHSPNAGVAPTCSESMSRVCSDPFSAFSALPLQADRPYRIPKIRTFSLLWEKRGGGVVFSRWLYQRCIFFAEFL